MFLICDEVLLPAADRLGSPSLAAPYVTTVIMDSWGVIIAVSVSRTILDGPFGAFLIAKLGW